MIRRQSYRSTSDWGFEVLGVRAKDTAEVQRAYRNLMKKLHPDKVQNSASVSNALESIKEAKDACERCLSRQYAPGAPRKLSVSILCSQPGRRRYRINWTPPLANESAPVRRYIVAALDPAYGRALNISVLEPDYDDELKRFLSIDELGTYVLAEEELQKMPALWRQNAATIQVAAANDAGQSSWSTLQVPLNVGAPAPGQASPAGNRGGCSREDDRIFADELRRRTANVEELRIWLERQRKPQLSNYLKGVGWPENGSKNELMERVLLQIDRERNRC